MAGDILTLTLSFFSCLCLFYKPLMAAAASEVHAVVAVWSGFLERLPLLVHRVFSPGASLFLAEKWSLCWEGICGHIEPLMEATSRSGRVFASVRGEGLRPQHFSSVHGFCLVGCPRGVVRAAEWAGSSRGVRGDTDPLARLNPRGLVAPRYCLLWGSDFTLQVLGEHKHSVCVSWVPSSI